VNQRFSPHSPEKLTPILNHLDAAPLAPVLSLHERVPDVVDAQLARLAMQTQAGNIDARNALYLALRPRIAASIRKLRFSGNWERVEGRSWFFEDLEQEAFLIFCELIIQWKPEPPRFAGYFFSHLPWRLRDRLRSWSATTVRESAALPLDVLTDDIAEAAVMREMLNAILAMIAPADALVLRLRFIDGMSDAAAARELGICTRTVRRRRVRALRAIRASFEPGDIA
jgi:RNA polymerase sigma factor (sigma-70 family)